MQIVTLFDLPIPHFVIFAYAKKTNTPPIGEEPLNNKHALDFTAHVETGLQARECMACMILFPRLCV